jgi:hypothetical protein
LADYKGKFVVLEWYNRGCPFIRKHYDSQNMQTLQAKYGQKGVVWFELISSAPGKEGYLNAADAEAVLGGSSAEFVRELEALGDAALDYSAAVHRRLIGKSDETRAVVLRCLEGGKT